MNFEKDPSRKTATAVFPDTLLFQETILVCNIIISSKRKDNGFFNLS